MYKLKKKMNSLAGKLKAGVHGLIHDHSLKERITILRKEIDDFESNPSNNQMEEMLVLHRKQKDFDQEFFT